SAACSGRSSPWATDVPGTPARSAWGRRRSLVLLELPAARAAGRVAQLGMLALPVVEGRAGWRDPRHVPARARAATSRDDRPVGSTTVVTGAAPGVAGALAVAAAWTAPGASPTPPAAGERCGRPAPTAAA